MKNHIKTYAFILYNTLRFSWLHVAIWCIISVGSGPVQAQTRIACIGNSITAGGDAPVPGSYPSVLAQKMGSDFTISNCGVGGITMIRYPHHEIMQKVLSFKPHIVTILLGTNDARSYEWKGEEPYIAALKTLIESLNTIAPPPKIYICYPPPATPNAAEIQNDIIVGEIIPALRSFALSHTLDTIDLHRPFIERMRLFTDGIHPNAAATEVFARIIHETIDPSATESYADDITPPDAPTGLYAMNVYGTSFELCWDSVFDPEAGVEYYLVTPGRTDQPPAKIYAPQTFCRIENLQPNETTIFTVQAMDYNGNISAPSAPFTITAPPYQVLPLIRSDSAIAVDGEAEPAWDIAPLIYLRNNILLGYVQKEKDIECRSKILWDNQHLYFLNEVTDDVLNRGQEDPWDNDAVEIFIDPGNTKAKEKDEAQFHFCFQWDASEVIESMKRVSSIKMASTRTDTGYILELAIPHSLTGLSNLFEGEMVGLDIIVDDNDEGDHRQCQIAWWGTASNWGFPFQWGTGVLVDSDFVPAITYPQTATVESSGNAPAVFSPFSPKNSIRNTQATIFDLSGRILQYRNGKKNHPVDKPENGQGKCIRAIIPL